MTHYVGMKVKERNHPIFDVFCRCKGTKSPANAKYVENGMVTYEFFSEQLRQLKKSLGRVTGDEKHDTKAVLEAERKLKAWIDNTPIYLQLQWFDTVKNVKVSSILANKRWTTEITARDALYLEKLGVKLTV